MPEQPEPEQPTDAMGWLESAQKFAANLFVGEEAQAMTPYNWMKRGTKEEAAPEFPQDIPSTPQTRQRANNLISIMRRQGLNDRAIAVMMGNIAVETGGSYSHTQKQRGGGKGYGLFQYDFMRPHYESYIKKAGLPDSPESQVRFAYETIYGSQKEVFGPTNARKLASLLDDPNVPIEKALGMFVDKWENPLKENEHMDRRMASTNFWVNHLKRSR